MGYLTTRHNEFQAIQQSYSIPDHTDRINVTPGANNAMGSWTTIFTAVEHDTYHIEVRFSDGTVSGVSLQTLADVGVDPAGGTSFTTLIPKLMASMANNENTGGRATGYQYWFPLFIKAGSRLAIRMQQNQSPASSVGVRVTLYQKPTLPHLVRTANYVDVIGADLANSRGTVITPGSSKGAWTSLGSAPRDGFHLQCAMAPDDSTCQDTHALLDIATGSASVKRTLIQNHKVYWETIERVFQIPDPEAMCQHYVPAGATLYARASVNTSTPDSDIHAMAWLAGGY